MGSGWVEPASSTEVGVPALRATRKAASTTSRGIFRTLDHRISAFDDFPRPLHIR